MWMRRRRTPPTLGLTSLPSMLLRAEWPARILQNSAKTSPSSREIAFDGRGTIIYWPDFPRREGAMNRRRFLKLGAVTGGVFALGGAMRTGGRPVFAQSTIPPTVDRLVITNVVDNIYDVFAKAGKLDTITVERIRGSIGVPSPVAEHGLAYHLGSTRGSEHREILLDFALTERNL